MQVVEYRDRLLPDLGRLANRHLALLIPGWELTERQLASVLRLPGDGRDTAQILWLLSDPESRGGLRTLLEAACGRAARMGCRRITSGDGCGVCPARYGVPASWAHLGTGLSEHGFEVKSPGSHDGCAAAGHGP